MKKEKKNNKIWQWARYTLVAVQTIVSVTLVISLISMHILDALWVVLITLVLIGLTAFSALTLISKKSKKQQLQMAGTVVAIISIVGCIVALRYTGAINGFLNKVTERKIETKEYSVAVLNESNINEVQELAGQKVGFLSIDTEVGKAEQYLENVVDFEPSFYDNLDAMAEALNNQTSVAITLETDRLRAVDDEGQGIFANTRVIYTFEIELNKGAGGSDKDVVGEPFVVYISGSDSRGGIKATARSDVNIVAVVNPAKGKILLISIPRDTYVQLHGTTGLKDKLTHAGIYGIDMSKETIEDFLGVSIDHTIKVSFDTVVKVVDELDGIEIDSDTAMRLKVEGKDKYCDFQVGVQEVDGDCALRFARERKSYKTGDRHRGENQQHVITSIINKLDSSNNYLLKVPTILDIAGDSFETTFEREDVETMIRAQLNRQTDWKVESISVDGAGAMKPTYSMGANRPLYVMEPNAESLEKAVKKINQYLNDK